MSSEELGILLLLRKIKKAMAEIFGTKATDISSEDLSFLIRKSMCNFQLNLANYQYSCSNAHKDFKDSLRDKAHDDTSEKYDHLETIAVQQLGTNICAITKEIDDYFSNIRTKRKQKECQLSVHVLDAETGEIEKIAPNDCQGSWRKSIDDYSAFSFVDAEGVPYLCNDTPREIFKNPTYRYGSLNLDRIRSNYKRIWKDWKFISRWRNRILKGQFRDEAWNEVIFGQKRMARSAFKSHLIIPVTFRAHVVYQDLDNNLIDNLELHNDSRSILGYIVIDHPETYFFDDSPTDGAQNIDVNILYVYADMISLLLLTFMTYTSDSSASISEYKRS